MSSPARGHDADRGLDGLRLAVAAAEDPLEHAAVLAEPGPDELAVVVLAEPVDVEDLRQLVGVALRRRSRASARSSRPCRSRRTAASRTGRSGAGRPCRRRRRSSPRTSSRRGRRRAPSRTPRGRAARRWRGGRRRGRRRSARRPGPPTRRRSTGTARPATVKRAFGCAAGASESGVQSLPCQSMAWAGGSAVMPSHQTSPSSVRAQLVKIVSRSIESIAFGLVFVARARRDAEEAGLGVDRVEAAVVAELHPGDVVADGLDLPARQVGISIARLVLPHADGKAPVDVLDLALGRGQLEDQHVLGHPALVAGHRRGDPQRQALLAEQGVAAVAGAVGPDLAGLGVSGRCTCRRRCVGQATSSSPSASGSPTECTQGTNSPSAPSTSRAPCAHPGHDPHRDDHVGRVGELRRRSGRLAEPSGPIENGTTYIVRPLHAAVEQARAASRASRPGRASCWSGRRRPRRSEQMKVRSSTRATSLGSDRAR